MKVGLTYDLKDYYISKGFSAVDAAEFDSIETVEGIENALLKLGFETDRIGNAKELINRISAGEAWDFIFNIAEGVKGISREAQVPAILDLYDIPYVFSDPMVLSLTLHKGMAKRVVRDGGVNTADFEIIYSEDDLKNIKLNFPLFAKPLSEGTGKGIGSLSFINSEKELSKICKMLLKEYDQPVIIEEFLPGREFTVGITGTGKSAEITGVMEINFLKDAESEAYGLVNKKNYEKLMKYTVPENAIYEKCSKTALKAWQILECRDGGRIDLRCDRNGELAFIEVNPLAGLNPIDSDLPILSRLNGISYDQLIERIVNSAMKRIGVFK